MKFRPPKMCAFFKSNHGSVCVCVYFGQGYGEKNCQKGPQIPGPFALSQIHVLNM